MRMLVEDHDGEGTKTRGGLPQGTHVVGSTYLLI
jgi:hypothetical protein